MNTFYKDSFPCPDKILTSFGQASKRPWLKSAKMIETSRVYLGHGRDW